MRQGGPLHWEDRQINQPLGTYAVTPLKKGLRAKDTSFPPWGGNQCKTQKIGKEKDREGYPDYTNTGLRSTDPKKTIDILRTTSTVADSLQDHTMNILQPTRRRPLETRLIQLIRRHPRGKTPKNNGNLYRTAMLNSVRLPLAADAIHITSRGEALATTVNYASWDPAYIYRAYALATGLEEWAEMPTVMIPGDGHPHDHISPWPLISFENVHMALSRWGTRSWKESPHSLALTRILPLRRWSLTMGPEIWMALDGILPYCNAWNGHKAYKGSF